MGNSTSCAPSIICSNNGVIKVFIFCNGDLQIFSKPVKAAELMLENPGNFLCDSESLKVGQRIEGLSTDEELEAFKFYFLLPMELLLYSVLTEDEIASFTSKAALALKQKQKANYSKHFGKIFPVSLTEFCLFPSSEVKTKTDCFSQQAVADDDDQPAMERFFKQRSWKPALETVFEHPNS
ncbi:uncharacterized protein LOC123195976 [Mangifera indica]|uniref:uncharacterized protein LOC123195976 n=1 Tax=Mangifera indica TaxID=29780 RepID=UPI001CF99EAE|nr:uncharacterized protein LOC123195976 [Mangifera indica]